MKRREFITLVGGAAAAWPLAMHAQQGVRRVAVLSSIGESDQEAQLMAAGLHEGLQASGWVNGRNLRIDHRWAAGSSDRIAALAKELVALFPDVIVSPWPGCNALAACAIRTMSGPRTSAGSTNFLPTRAQMRKALPSASAAAFGRST
jgi:ABC-type uncharacterized transport system substrate-binding protein